uniref:Uncharacterized protein n=1 Tax=Varanus komodoensis TaxID=61221 RepID=A0A8D2Q427_VARKO
KAAAVEKHEKCCTNASTGIHLTFCALSHRALRRQAQGRRHRCCQSRMDSGSEIGVGGWRKGKIPVSSCWLTPRFSFYKQRAPGERYREGDLVQVLHC